MTDCVLVGQALDLMASRPCLKVITQLHRLYITLQRLLQHIETVSQSSHGDCFSLHEFVSMHWWTADMWVIRVVCTVQWWVIQACPSVLSEYAECCCCVQTWMSVLRLKAYVAVVSVRTHSVDSLARVLLATISTWLSRPVQVSLYQTYQW